MPVEESSLLWLADWRQAQSHWTARRAAQARHWFEEEVRQGLLARLKQLRATLDEHRLSNFTGAMLRHHSMKSTQYMAQWIEAKNKVSNANGES